MSGHDGAHVAPLLWPWILLLGILALAYGVARLRQPTGKPWPYLRTWSWYGGLIAVGFALIGPVAAEAHRSFEGHMRAHLLLGMLAPILLVLGAPVTLLLRAMPRAGARRLVAILSSPLPRCLAHPVPAALLQVGGMVALYRTGLYEAMHRHDALAIMVHAHLLVAGYLFTASIIGIDPVRHRPSYPVRAAALVTAAAAHAIIAKALYRFPPAGVPTDQAEAGSALMYYGGDAIELIVAVIFCAQWYRSARPRHASQAVPLAAAH